MGGAGGQQCAALAVGAGRGLRRAQHVSRCVLIRIHTAIVEKIMADLLLVMAAHERANKEDLEAVFMKVRAIVRAISLYNFLVCEPSPFRHRYTKRFRVLIVSAVFLANWLSTT